MENTNPKREVDERNDSTPASNDEIVSKLSVLFGDRVMTAFQTEEVLSEEGIKDLITREADAPIFARLGLTYGKAVRFKAEFAKLFPQQRVLSRKASPSNVKPRMEDIARFSPELKSTYLLKRKRVGVLASAHWKGEIPKLNTPQRKTELSSFASSILPQCGMLEVGFNEEGIMEHVKTYFNEQRRNKRVKPGLQSESNTSSHSDDSDALKRPITKIERKGNNNEDGSSASDDTCTPSTLSVESSGPSDDEGSNDENFPTLSSMEDDKKQRIPAHSYNLKTCQMIFKAVFGMPKVNRDDLVKLNKNKFGVKQDSLTSLSLTQLMEVTVKKLINQKYCTIKDELQKDMSQLKMADIVVHKEISI